jgi:hypothetical protein
MINREVEVGALEFAELGLAVLVVSRSNPEHIPKPPGVGTL